MKTFNGDFFKKQNKNKKLTKILKKKNQKANKKLLKL